MILDTIKRWFGGGAAPEGSEGSDEAGTTAMLTCAEALEWIYEYMDGELPDADAEKVDRHFQKCRACYPHLRLEESFRTRLRTAAGVGAVPEDVRTRVMSLLAREESGGG